ncbi:MAG: GGDEF domain-containing protein [Fervidobacterium sp.]
MNLRSGVYFPILISFLMSVLLFFVIHLSFRLATSPEGIVLSRWNVQLPFYKQLTKPSSLELKTKFNWYGNKDDLSIIFPKVIGNRLEVYVNKHFVCAFGDKSGNIWPKALVVELPESVLKAENEISLILHGTVGYGVSYFPCILNSSKAKNKALLIEILRNNISLIAVGSALIISYILLFAFSIVDTPERKMYLYTGFAMLMTSFSLIQFIYRETSGSVAAYLFYEKMAIVFPVFGLTLIYFGLNESIQRKVPKFRRIILIASPSILAAGLFLSSTIGTVNILIAITQFYAMLLIFLTLFLIIRYKMKQYYFPIIFLALTALQTLYVLIAVSPDELLIVYGRIVFSLYIGTFTIQKFKTISEIKKFLERENLIDKLTGAYNRKIIDYIKTEGVLILLDLDNFKEINDKYGHMHGDELLKRFAELVKKHTRQGEDYFIRLGGDEFCIITTSLDVDTMINRIYNASRNELGLSFSYGYAVMRDFDEAYSVADKIMYERKQRLKRQK